MAKIDRAARGYRARFSSGGEILRDVTSEHRCDTQRVRMFDGSEVVTEPGCDDGTMGLYRRVWRRAGKGDRKDVVLYAFTGTCPKGHTRERYGYANPPEGPTSKDLILPGVE